VSTWDPSKLVGSASLPGPDTILLSNTGDCGGAFYPLGAAGGKFYAEFSCVASDVNAAGIGIKIASAAMPPGGGGTGYLFGGGDTDDIGYKSSSPGYKVAAGGVFSAYGVAWDTPSASYIVSLLFNADDSELSFWLNGADQGVAWSNVGNPSQFPTGLDWFIVAGQHGGAGGVTESIVANLGRSAFTYAPPVGYVAWHGADHSGDFFTVL
jgi:hypothetical protein